METGIVSGFGAPGAEHGMEKKMEAAMFFRACGSRWLGRTEAVEKIVQATGAGGND